MAETLSAQLQLDISQLTSALQQAQQRVQQFAQQVASQMQQVTTSLQAQTTATQTNTTATQQNAQANNQLLIALQNLQSTGRQQVSTLQTISTQLQDMQQATQQTSQSWGLLTRAWQVAAGLGIATTLGGIISALKNAATDSTQTAIKLQSLQATFVAITGSVAKARAELDFVREVSDKTGTSFLSNAQAFKGLEAAARGTSLQGQKTRDVFEAIAGASRVMGLSSAETHRVLVALEQMMSKGKVSAEELRRQLGNALPGAFEIAARAMGVTTKELDEMLKKGQILSEDFLPRFAAQVKRELGPGLQDAARGAAAEFARLGNNALDTGKAVGDAILTIVTPIVQGINAAIDALRRVRAEAGRGITEPEALPKLQRGTAEQAQVARARQELVDAQDVLREMRAVAGQGLDPATLENQRKLVESLEKAYAAMTEQVKKSQQQLHDWTGGADPSLVPFKRQTEDITKDLKDLDQTLKTLDAGRRNFPALFAGKENELAQVRDRIREIEKSIEKFNETTSKSEGLNKALSPELEKQAQIRNEMLKSAQADEARIQKEIDDARDAERERERLLNERVKLTQKAQEMIAEMEGSELDKSRVKLEKQVDDMRKASVDKTTIARFEAAGLAKIEEQRAALNADVSNQILSVTKDEFAGKRAALDAYIGEYRRKGADPTLVEQLEAAKRQEIDKDEARNREQIEEHITRVNAQATQTRLDDVIAALDKERHALVELHATKEQLARFDEEATKRVVATQAAQTQQIESAISQITAKETKSRVDDLQEQLGRKWQLLVQSGANEEQIARASTAVEGALREAQTEETQKELQKQAQAWRELGNRIESSLSSAFEQILEGSFDLFDTLKHAFIKLLADLAAEALTHQIIIPLIMQAVGAGGLASAGGAGAMGGAGAGTTGGGTDAFGTAMGMAQGGASLYNNFTGQSLLSNNGLLGPLLSTPLWGSGVASSYFGGTAAPLAGAYLTGADAGVVSAATPATGTMAGAIGPSVGTVLGGVGLGVGAGMLISQLNSMMGLHGTANTTLSGAAGGAIAGTMIYPGIGTIVGAIVGAIGGALAGILGNKHEPHPLFDPTHTQAGEVTYDAAGGLRLSKPFSIQEETHRDVGKLQDWRKTFDMVNSAINDMAGQVVSQFQNVSPELQQALVEPLNKAFADIAGKIDGLSIAGDDTEDFVKKMQEMMGTTIPGFFTDASAEVIGKLKEAVAKLDPVIKRWKEVIKTLDEDIAALQQQQAAMHTSLTQQIKDIGEIGKTPQQLLTLRQAEMESLMAQYRQGTSQDKIELTPAIQNLANTILQLAQQVDEWNTQHPTADPAVQAQLTGLQRHEATLQAQARALDDQKKGLEAVLDGLKAGEDQLQALRAQLEAQQTQLRAQQQGLELQQRAWQQQLQALQTQQQALQTQASALDQTLQAYQQLLSQFPQQLRAVTEALFTPAQSFLARQRDLTQMLAEFRAGTPAQQLQLEPQIASLVSTIMELAKNPDVLGQDPELVQRTQQQMVAVLTEVQGGVQTGRDQTAAQLDAVQQQLAAVAAQITATNEVLTGIAAQLQAVETQLSAGNAQIESVNAQTQALNVQEQAVNKQLQAINADTQAVNSQLSDVQKQIEQLSQTTATASDGVGKTVQAMQTAMTSILSEVRDGTDASYAVLIATLQDQRAFAVAQINLLVASLNNLDSIDAVVSASLDKLGVVESSINAARPVNDPVAVAQYLYTVDIHNVAVQQLGYLAQISSQIGNLQPGGIPQEHDPAFAQYIGSVTGRMPSFQHGTAYVPQTGWAFLHQGERVVPAAQNVGGASDTLTLNVTVTGDTPVGQQNAEALADLVIQRIERRAGRLGTTTLMVKR